MEREDFNSRSTTDHSPRLSMITRPPKTRHTHTPWKKVQCMAEPNAPLARQFGLPLIQLTSGRYSESFLFANKNKKRGGVSPTVTLAGDLNGTFAFSTQDFRAPAEFSQREFEILVSFASAKRTKAPKMPLRTSSVTGKGRSRRDRPLAARRRLIPYRKRVPAGQRIAPVSADQPPGQCCHDIRASGGSRQ